LILRKFWTVFLLSGILKLSEQATPSTPPSTSGKGGMTMSTWRKWLPGALGVTVLVVIFAVLVVRLGNARQELRTAMAVEPTGIYYSQNVMDGWNDGVYHYQPGDQSLVMGNDGVYHCQNYFEDGMRHMGWYTVDGRTIRFEATDGTVRAGVYVDGALYL